MSTLSFHDRRDAGQVLAQALGAYARRPDVLVLALPRGGVPVGAEVARALDAPLDVAVVRRLGVPGAEEFAMGAVAAGGTLVLNDYVVRYRGIIASQIAAAAAEARAEIARLERALRGDRPAPEIRGRTVILVDDGLCTGASLRAAAHAVRRQQPARVIAAAPVAWASSADELRAERGLFDDVVAARLPEPFYTVGCWYEDFAPPNDVEVRALLNRAARERPLVTRPEVSDESPAGPSDLSATVELTSRMNGELILPEGAHGVVVFAHGSGSGRHSPRNQAVARALEMDGFATLLLDLLTPEEQAVDERTRALRFDVALLADRLTAAVEWLGTETETRTLPIGLFGASTGAAAALLTAARLPERVSAVITRGGRPDLAGAALANVRAPTLLLVGERDPDVLALNEGACAALNGTARLDVVAGATHLFEEPGAIEAVARQSREWLAAHMR